MKVAHCVGVSEGWEEIYSRDYRRLVVLIAALCGSIADAEEAVQEAFVRAIGASGKRALSGDPQAWLYTVAANVVRNRWRRLATARRLQSRMDPEDADRPAERSDTRLMLLAALKQLPFEQREALALHYFADMPVASIAERIDVPVGTIKARLSRGRDALAAQLSQTVADTEVTKSDLESSIRPPGFSVIGELRTRRNRRWIAGGAAVVTALAVAGAFWATIALPLPEPVESNTPVPSATASTSSSPEPSTPPLQTAAPPPVESMVVSPTGTVFALRRVCVQACGGPSAVERHRILRSNDQAKTWTQIAEIPAEIGFGGRLAVASDRSMWIVRPETVLGSNDGGVTWRQWDIVEQGAFRVAEGKLWLSTGQQVLTATDGGQPVAVGGKFPGTIFNLQRIVALSAKSAIALYAADFNTHTWYRTDDSGSSWSPMPDPCAATAWPAAQNPSMAAAPGGALWAVCASEDTNGAGPKELAVSADGGNSWRSQGVLESSGRSTEVYPISATAAWRAESHQVLYRTTDAKTWTATADDVPDFFEGFVAIDADTAAYLDYPVIRVTRDGGRTWTAYPAP
jgi:RNA polymerase sigma-70 factor (ECF subfamily)